MFPLRPGRPYQCRVLLFSSRGSDGFSACYLEDYFWARDSGGSFEWQRQGLMSRSQRGERSTQVLGCGGL
ncbi:hypothetical protein L1887_14010 [Cichorium endivia]|nr:hypothetical protein L1887_14010 [Cichorium endivia]